MSECNIAQKALHVMQGMLVLNQGLDAIKAALVSISTMASFAATSEGRPDYPDSGILLIVWIMK